MSLVGVTEFAHFEIWIQGCKTFEQLVNIRENLERWGFDNYEFNQLTEKITAQEKELQIKKAPTAIEA